MVKGFMGIEYSTTDIKDGKFVDSFLESDFLQKRYAILRSPDRKYLVDESSWRRNTVDARREFLRMLEGTEEYNRIDFSEHDEPVSPTFTYTGPGCRVPKDVKTAIVASDCVEIEDGAFRGCFGLQSIVVGESLQRIGNRAFEGCIGLTSVRLPDATYIGDEAFLNCTGLSAIELGPDIQHIGMGAFKNCTSLAGVSLPPNCTFVGDHAFSNCSSLKAAFIPDGIVGIPAFCFENCVELGEVVLPSSIESVGNGAFENCPKAVVMVPTDDMVEAEELLGAKMVAKSEDDDSLFKCDRGFIVRLYKDLY